jgi:hypothetical protein
MTMTMTDPTHAGAERPTTKKRQKTSFDSLPVPVHIHYSVAFAGTTRSIEHRPLTA